MEDKNSETSTDTSHKITRRDFLKLTGLLGASAIVSSCVPQSWLQPTPPINLAPTSDVKERLKYIENHEAFKEMKQLYNQSGIPMPYTPDYFNRITSQPVDRADKVKCYAPSTGYESAFDYILKIYYELSGPDITRDCLHEIKVANSNFGAAEKRLEIPQTINLPQNQGLSYKYAGTLAHEWTHHWDLYPVIDSLDKRLKIDLLKAKAITRHGLIRTFNDCYEDTYIAKPEDLDPEYNLFYQLGNDLIINSPQLLNNLPGIVPAVQTATEINLVFDGEGKLNQETLSRFDNWKFYQAGLKIMEQIRPDPENISPEFKTLILNHIFQRGVISESIASVVDNVVKKDYQGDDRKWYVEEKYAMDNQLQGWVTEYISIINNHQMDLGDLISRIKNPTGNEIAHEVIISS